MASPAVTFRETMEPLMTAPPSSTPPPNTHQLFPKGVLKGHEAPLEQLVALPEHALLSLDQTGQWCLWNLQDHRITQRGTLAESARIAGIYKGAEPLVVADNRCWQLFTEKVICAWEQAPLRLLHAALSQDHTQLHLIQDSSDNEDEARLVFSCVSLSSQELLWSCQGPTTPWVEGIRHQAEHGISQFQGYDDVYHFSWHTQECTTLDRWKPYTSKGQALWASAAQGVCLEQEQGPPIQLLSPAQLTDSPYDILISCESGVGESHRPMQQGHG